MALVVPSVRMRRWDTPPPAGAVRVLLADLLIASARLSATSNSTSAESVPLPGHVSGASSAIAAAAISPGVVAHARPLPSPPAVDSLPRGPPLFPGVLTPPRSPMLPWGEEMAQISRAIVGTIQQQSKSNLSLRPCPWTVAVEIPAFTDAPSGASRGAAVGAAGASSSSKRGDAAGKAAAPSPTVTSIVASTHQLLSGGDAWDPPCSPSGEASSSRL